jgi:hypothetical protein
VEAAEMKDALEDVSTRYEPPQYTAQFALRQLFIVTTVLAIALGALTPWLRNLGDRQWSAAGVAILLLPLGFAAGNYLLVAAYARVIAAIGKPLGHVPVRPFLPRWLVIGWLAILAGAALALVGATINLASLSVTQHFGNIVVQTLFAGGCLAAVRKRIAVKSLLIFGTHGLTDGNHSYPWSAVTIREHRGRNVISLRRRNAWQETVVCDGDITRLLAAKADAMNSGADHRMH